MHLTEVLIVLLYFLESYGNKPILKAIVLTEELARDEISDRLVGREQQNR
ncbi:MAG: hypothetical protein WA919_25420 [Coleofasciculaceae cyanobacterium]